MEGPVKCIESGTGPGIVACSIFVSFMSVLDDCVDYDRGSVPSDTRFCCCVRFGHLFYVLFLAPSPIRPVSPVGAGSGIFGVHGSRIRVPEPAEPWTLG